MRLCNALTRVINKCQLLLLHCLCFIVPPTCPVEAWRPNLQHTLQTSSTLPSGALGTGSQHLVCGVISALPINSLEDVMRIGNSGLWMEVSLDVYTDCTLEKLALEHN